MGIFTEPIIEKKENRLGRVSGMERVRRWMSELR